MNRTISDATFRSILLGSLSVLLDPIITMLYTTTLSMDIFIQLNMHWTQVSRCERKNVNLATFPTMLQASRPKYIVCANQNYQRCHQELLLARRKKIRSIPIQI